VVCREAESTCTISALPNESTGSTGRIWKAVRCELLPYHETSANRMDDPESKLIFSMDRLLSSGTFYFTTMGDITGRRCLLHRCQVRSSQKVLEDEDIFLWNKELIGNVGKGGKVNIDWISPLMQGFASSLSFSDGGLKHSISLISRRSVKMAGTRYNARGIDDDGNVAIFTETECIVSTSVGVGSCESFSFVQVRGSVPVFWTQSASTSVVDITRNYEFTRRAFRQHVDFVTERYQLVPHIETLSGRIVLVNLLSKSKPGETLLSTALENQLLNEERSCTLVDFDFHKYVNSSKPIEESLIPLMDQLRPFIYHFNYFDSRQPIGAPQQNGIFRVNCLDCLDRTNVVQMMIAWEAVMIARFESFPKTLPIFKEKFFEIWIRNGDSISKGYSGTGSVLSRLVKTAGKTGRGQIASMLEHSWRSANRFIVSNWEDGDRHRAIRHLLSTSVEDELPTPSSTPHPELTVFVATWNLHGRRLDEVPGVLAPILTESTDIIVLNFQEVIDLNGMTVIFASRGDDFTNKTIESIIERQLSILSPESEYVQVGAESMVGLYSCVYIRRGYVDQVSRVRTERFKAGFGGAAGNKGSVSIFFRLFKCIDLEFINVHLDSGENRAAERWYQLSTILSNSDTSNRTVFLAGDFNFRTDGLSPGTALHYLNNSRVDKVRKFDPFLSTRENALKLAGFREMPLVFLPTYKYDVSGYLNERRSPSWCDRVFFKTNGPFELRPVRYDAITQTEFSDHKPVVSVFSFDLSAEQPEAEVTEPPPPSPPPLVDLLTGDDAVNWVVPENSTNTRDLLL
jgi:hypothetical protein